MWRKSKFKNQSAQDRQNSESNRVTTGGRMRENTLSSLRRAVIITKKVEGENHR